MVGFLFCSLMRGAVVAPIVLVLDGDLDGESFEG